MQIFPRWLSILLSYMSMFIIGTYVCSHVKFDTPVETYRWVFTMFFGLIFFIDAHMKK